MATAYIDLRSATLEYTNGGGGYISYVAGVHGGFTIADGVVIENATGGSGADTLIGNNSYWWLYGLGGADMASYAGGTNAI